MIKNHIYNDDKFDELLDILSHNEKINSTNIVNRLTEYIY